jgi:hypothetical protein
MKKVEIPRQDGVVFLSEVAESTPIFAKTKEGERFIGMLVRDPDGWTVKVGGAWGATGHHDSRVKCLKSCLKFGYTFYVED